MENNIKVKVEPVDYCFINKYAPSASLSCIVHLCFESEDGISYGWGANEQSLANTISVLKDFVSGKIVEYTELHLFAPRHMGKLIRHQSSLYLDFKENTCTYRFKRDDKSAGFDFVYSLSSEQLRSVLDQLKMQYQTLDWNSIGKLDLYTFDFSERPFEWCYSAKELEKEIESLAKGKEIKAIYVSSSNYIDPLKVKENFVNYFKGSEVLIQLDDYFIDLKICASGLFKRRIFSKKEVVVYGPRFDFIRDSDQEMCDILDVYGFFKIEYKNRKIERVNIESTNCWPWSAYNFDESKLGDPIELPEYLRFILDNGNTLSLGGWDDDFIIKIG